MWGEKRKVPGARLTARMPLGMGRTEKTNAESPSEETP